MLTVFQCITLTGWSFALYRTTDNTNPTASIYYVLLIAIGAYVLVSRPLWVNPLWVTPVGYPCGLPAGDHGCSRLRYTAAYLLFTF